MTNEIMTHPKTLVLDPTLIGNLSATGQLKAMFFERWSPEDVLQVFFDATGAAGQLLRCCRFSENWVPVDLDAQGPEEITAACLAFEPAVIYFRPTQDADFLQFSEGLIDRLGLPVVIHVMDDWLGELANESPEQFRWAAAVMGRLLERAEVRLSICEAMSVEYARRFGGEFRALANAVDPADYPQGVVRSRFDERPCIVRYMGALADNMTQASVLTVAEAVESLSEEIAIRMEIVTMPWFMNQVRARLDAFSAVSIEPTVDDPADYRALLQEADILLLVYNFDERSIRNVRYSLANKMPELLASGVPLLAFGPRGIATIDYLAEADCAALVDRNDPEALRATIRDLCENEEHRGELVRDARQHVAEHIDKSKTQVRFLSYLQEAIARGKATQGSGGETATGSSSTALISPYSREFRVSVDETKVVAHLFADQDTPGLMIDVGAHFGTALRPFLDRGWRVMAFEPDPANRERLESMLEAHPSGDQVSVDVRALSDEPGEDVTFFASAESTGISGLSAFHETHEETTRVQVTTLRDVLDGKPGMTVVDFLKIDTEGFDLPVLRGFPWDRIRPRVIEAEFEDRKTLPLGYDFDDIAGFLMEQGYEVYVSEWHPIRRYGVRHDWRALHRYPCDLPADAWGNLLAFREGVARARLVRAFQQCSDSGLVPFRSYRRQGTGDFRTAGEVRVAGSEIRFEGPAEGNYAFVPFNEVVQAGSTASVNFEFSVDSTCQFSFMVCRHGKGPFESSHLELELEPGRHSLSLEHVFEHKQSGYRFQLGCVSGEHRLSPILLTAECVPPDERPAAKPAVRGQPANPARSTLSLVTPSLNQVDFIDTTLDSIATQSRAPREHLVFDAGSTDGTLERLERYTEAHDWASLFVGEDRNQTHAINLGFQRSTGDIIAWLNSDDHYLDDQVFEVVLDYFDQHPEADIVFGRGEFIDVDGRVLREAFVHDKLDRPEELLLTGVGILQPSLFMRRRVFETLGLLNERLDYCMDYEYWIRAAKAGFRFAHLDRLLSRAVLHADSKTGGQRLAQLKETVEMVRSQYGFAPSEWVKCLVQAQVEGADGILERGGRDNPEVEARFEADFKEVNGSLKAKMGIWSSDGVPTLRKTVEDSKRWLRLEGRVVATASDSRFFSALLTQLAALDRSGDSAVTRVVFDLGLAPDQLAVLRNLRHTLVLPLPEESEDWFEGYFEPRAYGFKPYAASRIAALTEPRTAVLWLDAGVMPATEIDAIWEIIEREGIFLVDHDDVFGDRPLPNLSFATDECAESLRAGPAELLAHHLRAGVYGFQTGGRFQPLFDEWFKHSLDPNALVGDKHPAETIPYHPEAVEELRRREDHNDLGLRALREACGFLGHRHDQTILSILAARHGAKAQSARKYCARYKTSSELSKQNWKNDGSVQALAVESKLDETGFPHGVPVLAQHRGLIRCFAGLKFDFAQGPRAFVLGNGPSLRGFDFERLGDFDVFGMNAAYRHWDRIGIYPDYYSCLDLVVGLSHQEEIRRLIENAKSLGIRAFLLRNNLIEALGSLKNSDLVINFDLLKDGLPELSASTITTGSHTAAWAVALGYREVYMLGIDCNYVEIVGEAKKGEGTELTIVEEPENNPNYFFDDYQQPGDRYNIPNPNRDVHLESWREVANLIWDGKSRVLNANPLSKVDAFEFCDLEQMLVDGITEIGHRERFWIHNFVIANKLLESGGTCLLHGSLHNERAGPWPVYAHEGFEVNNAGPVAVSSGPALDGEVLLSAKGEDGAAFLLAAMGSAHRLPAVVEWLAGAGPVRPPDLPLIGALQERGYQILVTPERDEAWHRDQTRCMRFIPAEQEHSAHLPVRAITAFRDGVEPAEFYRASAQLELDFRKRLRGRGPELKAYYLVGKARAEEEWIALQAPAPHNFLCFAYQAEVAEGSEVVLSVTFMTDADVQLDPMLCRDGPAQFERTEVQPVQLRPGIHHIRLEHRFAAKHPGFRFQLGASKGKARVRMLKVVANCDRNVVVSWPSGEIDKPFVTRRFNGQVVSPADISLSIKRANHQHRKGNYALAIAMYLDLMEAWPNLGIQLSARACARKLESFDDISVETMRAALTLA